MQTFIHLNYLEGVNIYFTTILLPHFTTLQLRLSVSCEAVDRGFIGVVASGQKGQRQATLVKCENE